MASTETIAAAYAGDGEVVSHRWVTALRLRCSSTLRGALPYGGHVLTFEVAKNRYANNVLIPYTQYPCSMSTRGGPVITQSSCTSWAPVRSAKIVPTVLDRSEVLEALCVELRDRPHSHRTAQTHTARWYHERHRPGAECALAADGRSRRSRSRYTNVYHICLGVNAQRHSIP